MRHYKNNMSQQEKMIKTTLIMLLCLFVASTFAQEIEYKTNRRGYVKEVKNNPVKRNVENVKSEQKITQTRTQNYTHFKEKTKKHNSKRMLNYTLMIIGTSLMQIIF